MNKAKQRADELKELTLTNPEGWEFLNNSSSNLPSININENTLLTMSATWSAIRLISETIATLPLKVYRKTQKGRETAYDHPVHQLLSGMPNQFMTSAEMREAVAVDLCIHGQGYLEIERFRERVASLLPLPKTTVIPEVRDKGKSLIYKVTQNGQTNEMTRGQICPIRGFGKGVEGYALLAKSRNALAMGIAAEQYGASFFGAGARPTGVLMIDHVLNKEQRDHIRDEFTNVLNGADAGKRLAVLEASMKYQQVSGKNNEAQFLETRKFQVAEVARFFRVPLHMLFEMDRATYNNSYAENKGFLEYTLRPYLVRIEQSMNSTCLSPVERKEYYLEHDVKGLLRGSPTERADYYDKMRKVGGMTQNEIRRAENLPEMEGGDDLHVPMNMAPGDMLREILGNDEGNSNAN